MNAAWHQPPAQQAEIAGRPERLVETSEEVGL
jgi:hypothetical protein